jgi:hypothetical protein
VIDGVERGTFTIPSASVALNRVAPREPAALFIGNYYEGTNSGSNSITKFFGLDTAQREGLTILDLEAGVDEPDSFKFRHQLNAELHDVSIKRYYMSNRDIIASASIGPLGANLDGTVFYLPPFFTKTSPTRTSVGLRGGVLQTPFFAIDGTTDDPFNVAMSFGVGGHYMNLENFTYDFASQKYPRLFHLSASEISVSTGPESANDFLYDVPAVGLRNLLVLPCDDGNFIPNYDMLRVIGPGQKYTDDLGVHDFAWINLDQMVSSDLIKPALTAESGSFFTSIAGPTPEDPGIEAGASYAILQRTKDPSSNEITFFDLSNMFYGNRIYQKSLIISDPAMTASSGQVGITLRDNGEGSLYRADALTPHATWSSVGNVYYNEGIILIKDPSINFFGKHQFEMDFDGDQSIHVMKINVMLGPNDYNSSSNPAFLPVSASGYPNDPDPSFVYVTGINFHDDNFNVIAKTTLAQPFVKRRGERYLVKNKIDF